MTRKKRIYLLLRNLLELGRSLDKSFTDAIRQFKKRQKVPDTVSKTHLAL